MLIIPIIDGTTGARFAIRLNQDGSAEYGATAADGVFVSERSATEREADNAKRLFWSMPLV